MAWPDGRLIAKAGAIFGAPVAICWCFFCDFLVLFCSGSFLNCVFFLCLSGVFFGALAGKMARAHFAICWCFFCSGSFLNCVFFCVLLVLLLVLWLVLLFI